MSEDKNEHNEGVLDNKTIQKSEADEHSHNSISELKAPKSKLWIIFLITLVFMFVEAIVGYIANSLALMADAGHMLNDVISIFLALVAISLSKLKSTDKLTFGYKRVEVLSGLLNGISLLAISFFIIKEAIKRSNNLDGIEIQGGFVMIVAFIGLIINVLAIFILLPEKEGSLNIEGAYHHIIADALGSIAALIAGLGILLFQAVWLDLVASVLVSLLIIKSGLSITIRSLNILIQASPKGINLETVKTQITQLEGVKEIHDFHAWRVTDGMDVLTAHIIVDNELIVQSIKSQATSIASEQGFHHTTFQVECICDDDTFNCV